MEKKTIAHCPVCDSTEISISVIQCKSCNTRVETEIPVSQFFRLPAELQEFVFVFLQCRGSIRDTEKRLGISYPTVCKKLDQVNAVLGGDASGLRVNGKVQSRIELLEQVERGEISASEAAKRLRGR